MYNPQAIEKVGYAHFKRTAEGLSVQEELYHFWQTYATLGVIEHPSHNPTSHHPGGFDSRPDPQHQAARIVPRRHGRCLAHEAHDRASRSYEHRHFASNHHGNLTLTATLNEQFRYIRY